MSWVFVAVVAVTGERGGIVGWAAAPAAAASSAPPDAGVPLRNPGNSMLRTASMSSVVDDDCNLALAWDENEMSEQGNKIMNQTCTPKHTSCLRLS